MEYDGTIEYFDISLTESGTEQESVPDSVIYDSTESVDFEDNVVELKTLVAAEDTTSNTQQCDQQKTDRTAGVVLCVAIIAIAITVTVIRRCIANVKSNKNK